MKKITSFLTIALIAIISLTFTACDDDSNVAYTLDGTWRGKMYVQYGGYSSTYSVIRFDNNDGLYSGTGYWIDYYDGNYWGSRNYIANRITWTVRDGNIYINLIDEGSKVVIYDYRLSSGYFTGYVDASNGNRASFRLTKDDTFNWRDDFYYNKVPTSIGSISRSADTDSIQPMRKFVVK